jgi:hypothetical protein
MLPLIDVSYGDPTVADVFFIQTDNTHRNTKRWDPLIKEREKVGKS